MDAFVVCFCNAWEQLLKAFLIEKKGEDFIFRKNSSSGRIRETISLRECLNALYKTDDVVRKNIEKIVYYRDQAVHLLMPEVQGIMSRVFQSGVLNYSTAFEEFTEQAFISSSHAGMLSLVGNLKSPSIVALQNSYGKEIGEEILNLIDDLTQAARDEDDIQFAIPLNVKLIFAKKDDKGHMIELVSAEEGMAGLKRAIIVEKPADRQKTHPHKESDAIREINSRLYQKYSVDDLENRLVVRNKKTQKFEINTHCFRAVVEKLKWKNADNLYHYENKDPSYHYFSESAIEEFIKKIMSDTEYLRKAKQSLSHSRKKKK